MPDDHTYTQPPKRSFDRRDFLKLAGFTFTGAFLAGCRQASVEKAIPYLVKPEEITPGLATWYATTCQGCSAGCGIMAKVRDGRPIKLEGIPGHPVSQGGLCAAGQASLLGLYDSQRLMKPLLSGRETDWGEVDTFVKEKLTEARTHGVVRILTGTVTSPTTRNLIERFLSRCADGKHVQYDALSSSAILDAHEITHGARILPRYRFENAGVIVSFDADFLGTWISPAEFTRNYTSGRTLNGAESKFSYHAQIESRLSLTGTKADERFRMSPAEMRSTIEQLASRLAGVSAPLTSGSASQDVVTLLAEKLGNAKGKALVVCGMNDTRVQLLVNAINEAVGSYGATIDVAAPSFQKAGSDRDLKHLLGEISAGSVGVLIIEGVNPVYDLPQGALLAGHLKKIPLVITISDRLDETAGLATVACPAPHALETWSDGEPVAGVVVLTQPVIKPFGEPRTLAENLSAWNDDPRPMDELIKREWERSALPRHIGSITLQSFWDTVVGRGYSTLQPPASTASSFYAAAASRAIQEFPPAPGGQEGANGLALVLYAKTAMFDGRHAHNAWLQELPDPVTKIVWDNYASLSPATAAGMGVKEGSVVRIDDGAQTIELPAHIQPGQADGVVAVALGYGRKGTDRFTNIGPRWIEARPTVAPGGLVGRNAAPLLAFTGANVSSDTTTVRVTPTGATYELACTQEYHSLRVPDYITGKLSEPRPIVQETVLGAYMHDPAAGKPEGHPVISMWGNDHAYTGHRWGMSIDLSKCTGCAACVVSCQAENNIPLVGKDEVARNREMTWMRIDRYYDELPEGNVRVAHQPMMCQHCGNAPCETVCPVLATVHSEEGLNQQVYNRCVGTRYCANNCPYKIRRFNWFDYVHGDEMQKLALNPDVTVRERGIMEKCSFCVQRIQEAKITAKTNGVPLADGDVRPACEQSCPAQAIVFGDVNDPHSKITERMNDPRSYRVLEDLGVQPMVGYLTLVRNTEAEKQEGDHV